VQLLGRIKGVVARAVDAGLTAARRWRPPSAVAASSYRSPVAEFVSLELGGERVEIAVDRDADDGYTQWIRGGAATEPPVLWAQRFVQPDWQVLDLGANLGTFALPIARRCRRVIAVEAMPDNASLLTSTVARAGSPVIPVHAAVWERAGTVAMGDRSAWARVAEGVELDSDSRVIVPAATLAELVAVYADGPIDLVKIDIEGAEPQVLPQILDLAAERSEFVLIYESNQAVTDVDVRTMHRSVADAGFRLWYLDPRTHAAIRVDPAVPQYTINCDVLAVKGATPVALPDDPMTDAHVVNHLLLEMTTHPVTIHRSYAHVVAEHLPPAIRDHASIVAARSVVPSHQGAAAELVRFRRLLGSGSA
jgi:FkbM family methyltransferase